MYSRQGVQAWGYLLGPEGHSCSMHWWADGVGRYALWGSPGQASFHLWTTGTYFADLREVIVRKCWKDLQSVGASPMPFVHLLNLSS